MVDKLSWGVQALAAVTEETGGVGFQVKVQEKCPIDHCKAAVEDVKAVLKLRCREKKNIILASLVHKFFLLLQASL